ncbi:unnamed protein product [Pleuronectes platessa]|uniref:Uncharacterized protein n=1 Tax=Pleuronectes platessa TaxID=8262 RepID=A0A9N7VLP7_PLEPL|nr:unnamed protein product [Pleuronectes platessa]
MPAVHVKLQPDYFIVSASPQHTRIPPSTRCPGILRVSSVTAHLTSPYTPPLPLPSTSVQTFSRCDSVYSSLPREPADVQPVRREKEGEVDPMRSDSTPTYCSLKCPPPIHPFHSIVTESEGAEETGRLKAETRESD